MAREIKILGAGISGLTAAINLAKGGFDVTVFERASSVGCRFHNDFQGLENWTYDTDALELLKKLSIKTSFWNKGFDEVSIYTDLKREFVAKNANSLFYLVQRGPRNSLDENLRNQALDADVEIKFNSKQAEDECDIIATGISRKKPVGIVRGIVFDTDSEDSIVLILNDKLAFKGYAYLLIADGRATMACVVIKDLSKANICFENSLQAFTKLKRITINNKKSFGGYGTFSLNKGIQNQKLFVGEAAGFQDLFLGFGMKYAFLSGYIAARSIIEEMNYDKLWKELLLKNLMASASNRFIYEISGELGYNYIANQLGNSKNPKLWLKNHYSFGLIKKLVYPLAKYTIL